MTSTSDLIDRTVSNIDRTVDAVADLGWDDNGEEPITDSLDENLRDGTLIEVPSGTYLVDGMVTAKNLENWALRGTGDSREDVRFVVPEGKAQRIFNIRDNSRNVLLEGFTFDQYDTWETCIGNALQVADNLVVKDVEYAGKRPSEDTGATSHLNVYIFDAEGEAMLDGLEIRGASELIDYPRNALTVFCGQESVGTLYIRNCRFENCGEHAIYASRCQGNVRIDDCWFKNNQNTHARISGEGSYVKGSTFIWDVDGHPNRGEFQATTGMTFEAGFRGYAGGLVENCEFICKSSAGNSGCLKVDGSHGGLTVRDSHFDVAAAGAEPFWADAPGDSHMIDRQPDKPWEITLENVVVEGTGAGSRSGHQAAVTIQGRSGSVVRGGTVATPNRDGFRLADGDYLLEDVTIDVGDRKEVDSQNATVSRQTTTLPSYAHQLRVLGTEGTTRYEVDVSGKAGLVEEGEMAATAAESNEGVGETITEHEDGSGSTITGIVAAGGGDTFEFDGEIVDVRVVEGAWPALEVDGQAVDLSPYQESDGGDGTDGDEASTPAKTIRVRPTGTKGYVEPVIHYDGELTQLPSGASYTHYPEAGAIAFSTRDGWSHLFTVEGLITAVYAPEGVDVTVDGAAWSAES